MSKRWKQVSSDLFTEEHNVFCKKYDDLATNQSHCRSVRTYKSDVPMKTRGSVERKCCGRRLRSRDQNKLHSSFTIMIPLIFISFALNGLTFCTAQYQGDACNVDSAPGICTPLQQCRPIFNNILNGKLPRSVCGYNNFEPIVCCPRSGNVNRPTPTPPATRPGVKAQEKCLQIRNEIPKFIIGGSKVIRNEFVFMAAVGYETEGSIAWLCGGSLISKRFVVTAAHCTYNTNWGSASWVRLGDLNLETDTDDQYSENHRVVERIRHPGYRRPSEYHDIALLKLEKDLSFFPWLAPCCLPTWPDITSNEAIAMGWGSVEWAGDTSSDLLKVTLNLVPHPQCNRSFTGGVKDNRLEYGIVDDWQICAGGLGKDTCQGDSGGPLVVLNSTANYYNLIGVTSLGKPCGSVAPGIYTRVYHYVSWIENIVWPDA